MSEKAKSAGMIAGMVISWSLYYTFSKIAVDMTGSASLAGFMLRTGALIFLTVQLALGGTLKGLLKQGRSVIILISIGVFGFLLDLFANLGYAGGSLSTGTALLKTDVLMVNLATVVLYRKKLSLGDWLGTFAMLFGVLLVLGVDFGSMSVNPTDMFFILSAACVTANAFIIKTAQEKYHVDADTISYYNNAVVLILFASSALVSGDLTAQSLSALPKSVLWLALAGGLAQTGIYFFYYRNLKTHEVWIVKLYLLFMPVVSCFIGVAFLGESLTVKKILGIAVVLAGAAVILVGQKRKSAKHYEIRTE